MTLRGRIVLGTAAVLLGIFALAVVGVFAITQTGPGRNQIRRLIVSALSQKVHGRLYVGRISNGLFTSVTIDSLEIRDPQDSLFASAGRVTARYDLRDLIARRILLRDVHVEHPVVYLRQHENGTWNFREVFASTPQPIQTPSASAFVMIDSALVHDATFLLTLPWHPSESLHGVARDSAIKFELGRPDHEIRRTREGFARTWRWTHADATLLKGRVSSPDTVGSFYSFADVRVLEADPPFRFSNAHGTMRQLGDSIWVDVAHFDLPGTTGHGGGKVVWGSELPVRYDIHVHGDSVSLADVAWVYPTLPRTGGGKTDLDIRTEPRDLRLTDFILTNMDVRSTRSHLLGRMTFVIGADTLGVKDVQLAASPVNFDLLRTLNGKQFPYDWQGDITGTIRASGGNLARFRVEDGQFSFADANVPGAITQASAHGELNILYPAFTAFHDLSVNVTTLDLRTLQFLNKEFPRLNGTVYGTAVLDSSWLDVRFRDAQLTHRDGDGPESHVTGNGRVTWGDKYLTYDLDLQAQPLAFETIRKSYPRLPLHAPLSGPIRAIGQSPDLRVTTSLSGDAGTLTFDGTVDADPPVYGAHGTGSVTAANLQTLLANTTYPATSLSGTYALEMSGDTLPDLVGSASFSLAESRVGATTVNPSSARLRFGDGLVTIDTLVASTSGVRARASGTVATASNRTGSLQYRIDLSSVEELNRLLGRAPTVKFTGDVTLEGAATGPPGALQVTGTASASKFAIGTQHATHLMGSYDLAGLPAAPSGTVSLQADSMLAGPVPIEHASVALHIADGNHASFHANLAGSGTIRAGAAGSVSRDRDGLVRVNVDSARLDVDSLNAYAITAPVTVVTSDRGVSVDSVMLARARGGSIALRGAAVLGDSIRGALRTSEFSLAFLELFGSAVTDLRGAISANVDVSGTTTRPRLNGKITIDNGAAVVVPIGVRLDRIDADIALDGDSVLIRRLAAVTQRERRGTLDVTGSIAFDHFDNPAFALRASARNFRAIDRRGLASLDVSTTSPITLTGPYQGAVVSGAVQVDRGTVYIPEVVRKRVVDLNDPELFDVVDTTLASNRAIMPSAPSDFTRNLQLENVAITIGDEVWLRSDEANIKLGGSLNVTLGRNPVTGDRSQLALEGQLNAVRGTYRLNVVPFVQPTFDVEQGTLRFFGTPDLDPALDITAINTVRQPRQSLNGQDVRIRAIIGGTLSTPSLTLASADNLPLTQSDLLSYLITGQPAFALDYGTREYVNQLAAVAVRSAGNILSSAIPRSLFDVVELQTPTALTQVDAAASSNSQNFNLFSLLNTRAVVGKQLNNNLFLNFSTGFCAENFGRNLGLRLEYRLGRTYTAQFGIEPGSSDLVCARPGVTGVAQQTPPQFGVDFLRAWRF